MSMHWYFLLDPLKRKSTLKNVSLENLCSNWSFVQLLISFDQIKVLIQRNFQIHFGKR
jgi:hypothetical protein